MMLQETIALTGSLHVHRETANVGILRSGNRALLIDCAGDRLQDTLVTSGIDTVEQVLCTHHHRDSTSGLLSIPGQSTRICVPESERACFEDVASFWNDPQKRWHLYDYHPHNLMLTQSVPVGDTCRGGDTFDWDGAAITVLDTPGHTDGSLSFLLVVDGRRIVFCGDTIFNDGQILDLHSLQKGVMTRDYHGFLGARKQLHQSLESILASQPDVLVPTHGEIIENPESAVQTLLDRLDHCYDRYVGISALRHYFPDLFKDYVGQPDHMPIRAGKEVPDFLRHVGTTWIVLSETGEAYVMDCGSKKVIEQLDQWVENGDIQDVTGFWITHYHDDHVDAIPEFQEQYSCTAAADKAVAQVLEHPRGYRIPCISPSVARIDLRAEDADSWQWNEFQMTAYHLPGQTLYHGGLLVEGHGLRLFFAGDSFTMAGIDDYCSGNRNYLGTGVGFDYCLELIQQLQPTHIFNCHVDCAFDFTDQEIATMRANLAEREQLYGELFPWDHPNFGMDEHWVRCFPYEQDARPGETVSVNIEFTNHSSEKKLATCRPVFPADWQLQPGPASASIPPKSDGHVRFEFRLPVPEAGPSSSAQSRVPIPVDITFGGRPLGQFREFVLVLGGE